MDSTFWSPLQFFEEGSGFAIGSPWHFFFIAYAALLATIVVVCYHRLPKGLALGQPRRRMLFVVAACVIGLKTCELSIMAANGVLNVYWYPLHPCNICGILLIVYAIHPWAPLGEVLYTLGLTGSLGGILFADWIKRAPVWNFFNICGFTEHSLLIAFVLMLIIGGDFEPSIKRFWQPCAFSVAGAAFFRWFNAQTGTNFWFVNRPSPGSPLVELANTFGDPGYLVPFALGVFAIWLAMYVPWALVDRKRKQSIKSL